LFSVLPSCYVYDHEAKDDLEEKVENISIDFEASHKERLKEIFREIQIQKILPVNDDYMVEVHLKDPSVYAYASRKFAYGERQQIRNITDDLLNRGIIKPSASPYCARVIPVRKRNGQIRLCVDLRPLNSRVEKQKFPFPVIEECLTRLGNKIVFTLINLKGLCHCNFFKKSIFFYWLN